MLEEAGPEARQTAENQAGTDGSIQMSEKIDTSKIVIGQWATYFDTGIWSLKDGQCIAPSDLTLEQLKDFLLAGGGAVYLGQDGLFRWLPSLSSDDGTKDLPAQDSNQDPEN
jgi:hypothetical protein